MHARRLATIEEFRSVTGKALASTVIENNLMYAVSLMQPSPGTSTYFSAVFEGSSPQRIVAAAMKTPYNVAVAFWGNSDNIRRVCDALVSDIVDSGCEISSFLARKDVASGFSEAWQLANPKRPHPVVATSLCLHVLRKVIWPPSHLVSPGNMRAARIDDLDLVSKWHDDFIRECHADSPPESRAAMERRINSGELFLWIVDHGAPASMASMVRHTPATSSVSSVFTPKEQRGKGHATGLVAHLSQLILDSGKQAAVLFTDLSNPISNSVYRRIGYVPVCGFDSVKFP